MKSYKKTYIVAPYGLKITVGFCDEPDIYNYAKEFNANAEEFQGWTAGMLGLSVRDKYGLIMLFGNEITIGDIAHECNHMMNAIMSHIGNPSNRINDEPDSYLLGWLVDRAYECLKKFHQLK